ncbi:hypothetical protein WHR41_06432 [Cladosporium halotolerans]|uniref:Fungal N-terminal domain-containing protein n=1 Tax=Cladosporium halotolerans TaxID=1052096 RepID=A0AB34KN95_9PEZI
MAEAFGVAGSAIQVADAGFKLYGALSQYVRDYVGADKHTARLADEVKTTSWALKQLGIFLQEDEKMKLCKPEVIAETQTALDGCQAAFGEVEHVLKDFMPISVNGALTGTRRFKWPFKKSKAQLLLAQFERLKTNLLLVFKVLSYASKLSSQSTQDDLSFLDDRTQVTILAKAKADSVEAMSKLLPNPETQAEAGKTLNSNGTASIPLRAMRSPREPNASSSTAVQTYAWTSAATFLPVVPPTVQASVDTPHTMSKGNVRVAIFEKPHGEASSTERSSVTPKSSPSPQSRGEFDLKIALEQSTEKDTQKQRCVRVRDATKGASSKRSKMLSEHLDHCASAVSRLGTVIGEAKRDLHLQNNISMSSINSSLRSTKRAFSNLAGAESDLDSEPEKLLRPKRSPPALRSQGSSSGAYLPQPPAPWPRYDAVPEPINPVSTREESTTPRASTDPVEASTPLPSRPPKLTLAIPHRELARSSATRLEPLMNNQVTLDAYSTSSSALSFAASILPIDSAGEAESSARGSSQSPQPYESHDVRRMRKSGSSLSRFDAGSGFLFGVTEDDEPIDVPASLETVDDLVRKWTHVSPG